MLEEMQLQAMMRQHLGLRIGREMAVYLLRQMSLAANGHEAASIPVMATDARTGIPLRREVPAQMLRQLAQSVEQKV